MATLSYRCSIHAKSNQASSGGCEARKAAGNQAQTHSSAACLDQEAWVTSIGHRGHFLEGIACGAWPHSRAAARSSASSRQRIATVKYWLAERVRRSCTRRSTRACGDKLCETVPAASLATSPAPPPLRSAATSLRNFTEYSTTVSNDMGAWRRGRAVRNELPDEMLAHSIQVA